MESGGLYTPNGGKRGGRRGNGGFTGESHDDDMMDISSAARDLRELSQLSVGTEEKGGPGGGRATSSGRMRSGGFKAGRSKGECFDPGITGGGVGGERKGLFADI